MLKIAVLRYARHAQRAMVTPAEERRRIISALTGAATPLASDASARPRAARYAAAERRSITSHYFIIAADFTSFHFRHFLFSPLSLTPFSILPPYAIFISFSISLRVNAPISAYATRSKQAAPQRCASAPFTRDACADADFAATLMPATRQWRHCRFHFRFSAD